MSGSVPQSSYPQLCLLITHRSTPLLDADGTRNRQPHGMSSVVKRTPFGRVVDEGPPQELRATDHHSHALNDSLPELPHPSSSALLGALSVPIPDPLHDQRAQSNHAFPVNRASSPARWPSSLCNSAAPSGAESHSGESHAEAAACQVKMASPEQPCLSAKSNSSGVRSNSSGAKCPAADVVSASAAVRDSEMHSGFVDAVAAVPFASGLQVVQQGLTQPDSICQNLQADPRPRPAEPGSQMTSHHQEHKHKIKQGVKPEALNAHTFSAASSLATSWPRVSHVGTLRHGKQLRQAAAEAAATAAGQAARAESAVRLHTPPTIAFHSIAAKHAVLAAEAAAAAAAVTADSAVQGAALSLKHRAGHSNTQLLGWAGQLPASAPKAGRLHESAPASPVQHGKHSSSALGGRYAEHSMDPADVQAPGHAQHQHASRGECLDVLELFGNDVLPRTASAPPTPVITRAAGNTVREHQQGQESFLSSCSVGLLADAHCHHLPQQHSRQSVQSTNAGWKMDTDASQHARFGQPAQLPQHGQRSQHAQRGQQAQHEQQATWEQEGTHPMEDPFKASEQFPICPDLCLSLPNSKKQDSQQECLLIDCTHQLTNPQSRHCQTVRPPSTSPPQPMPCSSRSDAAVTAALKESMAPHQGTYQNGSRSMQAESRGRAELATETLSSLTDNDFWEAARAELLDTAEPVRHKSCISDLDTVCPSEMSALPMVADKMQHTPEPRMNIGPVPASGITPLLCKSKYCAQGCCNESCCTCCREGHLLLPPSADLIFALLSLAVVPYMSASGACVPWVAMQSTSLT